MTIIVGILKESYFLLNEMAPYLLFGFFFAGVLHIFFSAETVSKHLGKNDFLSVVKASLFGIPLPLCSCGVIPAAMSLRKEGAKKGAVLSFLISTPTTGIDSILATYALLGPFFAVFRVIASFVTGVFSGVMANLFIKEDEENSPAEDNVKCKLCHGTEDHDHRVSHKIKGVFSYAFGELLSDTGAWLLAGIVIGGIISYFLPEEFIRTYLGYGWKAMAIMLVVGIPMYVCASGSIPIAAALMMKGMNPGAAFVFLLAGPATNAVSVAMVSNNLGKKAVVIYLGSIAVCAVGLGIVLDHAWGIFQPPGITERMVHSGGMSPWIEITASMILLGLIGYNFVRRKKRG